MNLENIIKKLEKYKNKIIIGGTILTSLLIPNLLNGDVSAYGIFHAKQDSIIRGYAPVEIISNYDYETDTTDAWGVWGASLLNTNIGDTVWVNARKDTLGKIYKVNLKDLADGIGQIPDAWMYDSAGTELRTLSIYKIIDSLNQNNWDSLKPLTKIILPNKPAQPDSMVVDTAGQKIYNPSNYDDWRWESHRYDVYMPLWDKDSLPINIQPGDTGVFALYKLNPTADSVKAFIDTMIYTGKYGDAWVREVKIPINWKGEQYDTLILKEDYVLEPYNGGIDTIPLWKGTINEWNQLWSQITAINQTNISATTTDKGIEFLINSTYPNPIFQLYQKNQNGIYKLEQTTNKNRILDQTVNQGPNEYNIKTIVNGRKVEEDKLRIDMNRQYRTIYDLIKDVYTSPKEFNKAYKNAEDRLGNLKLYNISGRKINEIKSGGNYFLIDKKDKLVKPKKVVVFEGFQSE